jgi:guanylate kinase
MTTSDRIHELRSTDNLIWINEAYGSIYAIDRSYLDAMIADAFVPVLHAGQVAAVRAITAAIPTARVTSVYLTCPRRVVAQRVMARATDDTRERLASYDSTEPLDSANVTIDTSTMEPENAAGLIARRVWSD